MPITTRPSTVPRTRKGGGASLDLLDFPLGLLDGADLIIEVVAECEPAGGEEEQKEAQGGS